MKPRVLKGIVPKKPLMDVVNLPVTQEVKVLLACYCLTIGAHAYTPVARAFFIKGLMKAIRELDEEDQRVFRSVVENTILADRIEQIMLDDIEKSKKETSQQA